MDLSFGKAGLAGDGFDHLGTGHVSVSSWNVQK